MVFSTGQKESTKCKLAVKTSNVFSKYFFVVMAGFHVSWMVWPRRAPLLSSSLFSNPALLRQRKGGRGIPGFLLTPHTEFQEPRLRQRTCWHRREGSCERNENRRKLWEAGRARGSGKRSILQATTVRGAKRTAFPTNPKGMMSSMEKEPETALLSLLRAWDHLGSQGFSCLRTKVGGRGAVCGGSKGVGLA